MKVTRGLVSEMLRLGNNFSRDPLILNGPQKDMRSYISVYKGCLDANEFSEGEMHSLSREIYGLAKTIEKSHPELSGRYPDFFRTLDEVRRHVYRQVGAFTCMIDGEPVAHVEFKTGMVG